MGRQMKSRPGTECPGTAFSFYVGESGVGLFGHIAQLGESGLVVHSQLGQHLAVDLHAGGLQPCIKVE